MSTILESVNTLSEKLGVTEREQTIKDQLDLCVERLGGEGNSKDIADSAEKFAEKEDGTATFMTKTITENNTYNAADDGVSGYSSVTVNVPSAPTPETFEVNVTVDFDGESMIVSDKTYSEMLEAYNANKKVVGTLTYISDSTEEYDIIAWDKNNLNGNNSLYIFTSVLGEGQQTKSFVLGFLETGYYIGIASGDIIPNA